MYLDEAMYAAGGGVAPLDVSGSGHRVVFETDKNLQADGADSKVVVRGSNESPRERQVSLG